MLAQIEPIHNDFHALASYLIHGKERPTNPARAAWVFGHNLPTDDPMLAAHYMAATAELSKRCQNACYHASINWHPDEQPKPEVMQEIARKTLTLAGLGEHQALVMGHGDKPHKHLHLMINRVHPETGRAWSTSHDYRKFDAIMRQLSDEYGFMYVPPHSFHPELTDDLPKAPNSDATYAARKGAPTDRMQWSAQASREFGATLSEPLDRASSWDDIEVAAAAYGLSLEAKGHGLVLGDGESYTKFSALGLNLTANGLAKKFGRAFSPAPERSPPPRPLRWDADRILMERERLRAVFTGALSWTELEMRLAHLGLSLTRKGNGMVLADPSGEAALSSLGWSRAKLDKHFAEPFASPGAPPPPDKPSPARPPRTASTSATSPTPTPRRSPPLHKVQGWAATRHVLTVDAVDIARAIGSKEDLQHAVSDAVRVRKARLSSKSLMDQLMEELKEQLRASTLLSPHSSKRSAKPRAARSRATKHTHPRER